MGRTQMADGKPGRPRVAARPAETQSERRRQLRAFSHLESIRERLTEVDRMRTLAERERDRVIVRAVDAGITQAEVARILGLTGARVNQIVRETAVETQESDK